MAASKGSILVTGANGALGSATVAHILRTPKLSTYTGIYAVRKAATATELKAKLQHAPKSHVHQVLDLDLSSIASVKRAAADINGKVADGTLPPIRALILNAGYQDSTELTKTEDGFETSWQVNYLSNLILALTLLRSMDKENGRILFISSWSHDITDERNNSGGYVPYKDTRYQSLYPGPDALAQGKWSTPEEDPTWYAGYRRYGASKLCAVMLLVELGERIARDPKLANISVIGLDPGSMSSGLTRRSGGFLRFSIVKLMPLMAPPMTFFSPNGTIRTPAKSASDTLRACFEIDPPRGKALYLNGTDLLEPAKETKDEAKRREVWQYGIRAAAIKEGDTILSQWK